MSVGVQSELTATLVHTFGYLAVTTVLALVVEERLGLRLLGHYWFNLDALWSIALVVTVERGERYRIAAASELVFDQNSLAARLGEPERHLVFIPVSPSNLFSSV